MNFLLKLRLVALSFVIIKGHVFFLNNDLDIEGGTIQAFCREAIFYT